MCTYTYESPSYFRGSKIHALDNIVIMCRPRSHQINFRVFRTFHESIESMFFFRKNNSSFILTQEWNEFFTIIWNLWGESFLCTFVVYQINLSDRSFLGKSENTQECTRRIKVPCKCGNASKHTLQSEPSNREVCCSWEGFRSYQKFVISCFQKYWKMFLFCSIGWKTLKRRLSSTISRICIPLLMTCFWQGVGRRS